MVKIERDKPLPNHTKLDYDECYAKIILEKFFSDEYKNLQISDKPDLREPNSNIGIEVTTAIPNKDREAIALASEIPYIDEKKQRKRIAYLHKNGYEYTDFFMVTPVKSYFWQGSEYPDITKTFCSVFIDIVKKKLEKLNSGNYDLLQRYDLFVKAELYIEEWMPEKLLDKLVSLSNMNKSYHFIYLLTLNGLFVFNILLRKWIMVETGEKLFGLGELARDMVEADEISE